MRLHVFNPENDLALACFSPHFIPPRSARLMARDLAALPAWWAGPGDAVRASVRDGEWLRAGLQGSLLPALEWAEGACSSAVSVVEPWGWSPLLWEQVHGAGVAAGVLPDATALRRIRDGSCRSRAVELLAVLRSPDDKFGREWGRWLCGESFYCTDEDAVARLLARFPDTLLKAPWSGSGKGLRLGRGGWVPPLTGWCRRVLREQGGVVVEPIYNKVYDLAMEFYSDGQGRVDYRGLSRFVTTPRGTYVGNRVAPEAEHARWLASFLPAGLWQALRDELAARLSRMVGSDYRGPLGVDMMLCRPENDGGLCLHPCVEINLRRTMGQVAADLSRFLASGAEALFAIDYCAEEGGLLADHERRLRDDPPRVAEGRWSGGYLALTPVRAGTHYRASLLTADCC